MAPPIFTIIIIISTVTCQEIGTPSSLLGPRHFNHHPYEVEQYLKETTNVQPTKQGPVLFPNDGPPAPRNPLIVTSRPLTESIARSELNPTPQTHVTQKTHVTQVTHNSVGEQSQLNRVDYKPGFLKGYNYKPFGFGSSLLGPTPTPVVLINAVTGQPVSYRNDYYQGYKQPYVEGRQNDYGRDDRFEEYEKPALPPVYKALSEHANENLLRIQQKHHHHGKLHHYQVKEPQYSEKYENNRLDEDEKDYNQEQNANYAFSYKVHDRATGDDFSHSQRSSGSATNGEYRVRLPDGRMQIVSYTADERGYNANVRYDDDKTEGNSVDNQYKGDNIHTTGHVDNYKGDNAYTAGSSIDNNYKGDTRHTTGYVDNYKGDNAYTAGSIDNNYKGDNRYNVDNSYKDSKYTTGSNIDNNHKGDNRYTADNSYKDSNYLSNLHNSDYTGRTVGNNDNYENRQEYVADHQYNNQVSQDVVYGDGTKQNYLDDAYKGAQKEAVKDDYYGQYQDTSLENNYNDDYSVENTNGYEPHRSKFTNLANPTFTGQSKVGVIVVPEKKFKPKPSIEALKQLFFNRKPIPTQDYLQSSIPIEISVPSTTPKSLYETTTERVVLIGNRNLYTSIHSSLPPIVATTPTSYQSFSSPASYLASTLAPYRKNVDLSGPTPVLSSSFIDRINKYLSF